MYHYSLHMRTIHQSRTYQPCQYHLLICLMSQRVSSCHTEKSDYMILSCNVEELHGKSCWAVGSLLMGLYHVSCCCTGLQSMGFQMSSGLALHITLSEDLYVHIADTYTSDVSVV